MESLSVLRESVLSHSNLFDASERLELHTFRAWYESRNTDIDSSNEMRDDEKARRMQEASTLIHALIGAVSRSVIHSELRCLIVQMGLIDPIREELEAESKAARDAERGEASRRIQAGLLQCKVKKEARRTHLDLDLDLESLSVLQGEERGKTGDVAEGGGCCEASCLLY